MTNSFEYIKNNIELKKLKERQSNLRESLRQEIKDSLSKYYSDFDVEYDGFYDVFKVIFKSNDYKCSCVNIYDKNMDLSFTIYVYKINDLETLKKCFKKFSKDFIVIVKDI